jgi:hypothetical protein
VLALVLASGPAAGSDPSAPAAPVVESPVEPAAGGDLLLDDGIARSLQDAGIWGLRLGLITGWIVNGFFVYLADRSIFGPYPAAAVTGWLTFEWAARETPPLSSTQDVASQSEVLSYTLRLNMGLMATFMIASVATSTCNPLDPNARDACVQSPRIEWSLSFRDGFSRLLTRPVNLAADFLWKRFRGDAERPWKVLVAPIIHLGEVTGMGAGIQLTL